MNRFTLFSVPLLLLFSLPSIPLAASPAPTSEEGTARAPANPKLFTLDNGLTVILDENHTRPEIFGAVLTKAGGKNDPPDATGLAHYQEHMLFKGTTELGTTNWEAEKPLIDKIFQLYDQLGQTTDEAERARIQDEINKTSVDAGQYAIPNELSNIIKTMGGTRMNAGTGPDTTMFFNTFPPGELERWLELYSHRFMEPVFRSFQAELEVVYEEKNMYADTFQMSLMETFLKHFYKVHPYGQQTIIGTIDNLKNPSLTKMYEFFKTYYVANNMALILAGDFDTEKVIPFIRETFGRWRSGEVPPPKVYPEEPFKGRELVEARLSPIKLGLLGFRTVPNGHEDKLALDLCNAILFNPNQTGLLDRLTLEHQVMAAAVLPLPFNDYGGTAILFVPKVLGQSLEEAEALILAELEKLADGQFEDWALEAAKNNAYVQNVSGLESNQQRAVQYAQAFAQGRDILEVLTYPERLMAVTREDVVRVAKKYYGKDYLAFFSEMGFPKKEKIEKPGYEPVLGTPDARSEFARKLDEIPVEEIDLPPIDFEKDIHLEELAPGVRLYYKENPVNDVFTLTMKYGIGEHEVPELGYAARILDLSGAGSYDVRGLKRAFSELGCNYEISADESFLTIKVRGMERNLEKVLELTGLLMKNPVLDGKKLDVLVDEEETTRKMERSEPDNVAEALIEWVRFGDASSFLNRLSVDELKKLDPQSLVKTFQDALQYEQSLHYVGQRPAGEVRALLEANLPLPAQAKASESPVQRPATHYDHSTVYLVHKKKARQCKIQFFANGDAFHRASEPVIDAFNLYFGGGFSGLVLQEIREYRSMAYAAGATYMIPEAAGYETAFTGYIGTQADKTLEALEVFVGLVRNMPERPERMQMIKPYLEQTLITQRPGFRDLTRKVEDWTRLGYSEDPAISKKAAFSTLTFDQILEFYREALKDRPVVIAVVGDKKQLDLKALEPYGEVVLVKEKSLFR